MGMIAKVVSLTAATIFSDIVCARDADYMYAWSLCRHGEVGYFSCKLQGSKKLHQFARLTTRHPIMDMCNIALGRRVILNTSTLANSCTRAEKFRSLMSQGYLKA